MERLASPSHPCVHDYHNASAHDTLGKGNSGMKKQQQVKRERASEGGGDQQMDEGPEKPLRLCLFLYGCQTRRLFI